MPKGIFNGPRPFAEYRLIIDLHEQEISLIKVGPFGGPRPFAKNNPPVSEDRVNECVVSRSGRRFGAGVVRRGERVEFSELTPPERLEAMELAEDWCRGTLEASAMDDLDEGEATELREAVEQQLEQMIEEGEEFDVDFQGELK